MDIKSRAVAAAVFLACAWATTTQATPIQPLSYDMHNGQVGTYTYFDDTYTGSGSRSTSASFLSGGWGDLTDGIVATAHWNSTPDLYVGWYTVDPFITFDFGSVVNIDSVTLYVDDATVGGVTTPGSVSIGGVNFAITDSPGAGPHAVTISGLDFSGSSLDLQLFDGNGPWVFVSEIEFDGRIVQVPEPGMLVLIGLGMTALALGRRRRR